MKLYGCRKCGMVYWTSEAVIDHIRQVHGREVIFSDNILKINIITCGDLPVLLPPKINAEAELKIENDQFRDLLIEWQYVCDIGIHRNLRVDQKNCIANLVSKTRNALGLK